MNRRFVHAFAVMTSLAALAPFAVGEWSQPAQAARRSEPIGAVAMMAGKTVTGTIPYGERTFRPADRTLSCIVVFAKPSPGTRVRTQWIAVDAGGMKNTRFNEDELTMGQDNGRMFIFTMKSPWPIGKYQVKIFRDGKFDRVINFNIK